MTAAPMTRLLQKNVKYKLWGPNTLRDPSGYPSGGSPLIVAQLVVRVLPIAIRVPLSMGSSSHGGERKGQLGPAVTVPMSGLPP